MKLLFTILTLLFSMPVMTQAQIFVDKNATGTNTGDSWENAFTDLNDAISTAPASQQIWVAAATYYPSSNGDINASFTVTGSIEIYGGFNGTENSLDQRDINANPTTLSGDYNNNDVVTVETDPLEITFSNTGDNANRILYGSTISGTVVLDGLIFTGGDCVGGGAAILLSSASTLDVNIRHCQFIDNFADGDAAALRFGCATGNVLNTTVENCDFIRNKIEDGGGAKGGCVWSTGNGFITSDYINCNFEQNYSSGRGGAICTDMDVVSSYINCLFNENRASSGGAIFENSPQDCQILNCTFYKNSAWNEASVMYTFASFGAGDTDVYNSIFFENDVAPLFGTAGFDIGNSILDANSFADVTADASGSQNLGGNQFAVDPLFVDVATDKFNLEDNSPAINAGDNAEAPNGTDLTGYISRIVDGVVDLGVYENYIPMEAAVANALLCFGAEFGSAEITASQYPGFTYQWSDANVSGASPDNLMPGSNQVTVTNSIGDFVVLEVSLFENPEITATTSSTTSTGADGTASATANGGTPPYAYSWNTTPTQNTPTATDLPPGDYQVTITDFQGCELVVDVNVALSTAVHTVEETNGIQVGPNPFSNVVQINFSTDFLQTNVLSNIAIYNSTGQLVYQARLNDDTQMSLNLAQLATGLYIVELSGPSDRFQKRLIKQ